MQCLPWPIGWQRPGADLGQISEECPLLRDEARFPLGVGPSLGTQLSFFPQHLSSRPTGATTDIPWPAKREAITLNRRPVADSLKPPL